MAGDLSQRQQRAIMEYLFGYTPSAVFWTTADDFWFHLMTTTQTDASTDGTAGKCTGGNYKAQKLASSSGQWTAPTLATPSATQNKNVLTFTTNASTGWTTIKAVRVTSSSLSGGDEFAWGDLTTPQTISAGNTVRFSTGAIDFTLT